MERTKDYNLHYQFICCPKYGKKVLKVILADWLESLTEETADELKLEIFELAIQLDHADLFVTGRPKLAPSEIIQQIKGYSSRVLHDEYDFCLPSLWTRSYFVSSVGEMSSQSNEEYVEAQTHR